MPNTKSAKKRMRQSEVRRLRNRSVKSSVKTQVRKVREAITGGNFEEADSQFRTAVKRLDQAAAKGVIHKNAASRSKSRLSAAVKTAKQAATAKS
jgi:small subunit ribosomal protein S20